MIDAPSKSAQLESKAAQGSPSEPPSSLSRKLAALAGVAGAVSGAGEATADVVYSPTPGVVAAQGIPGFSFVSSSDVTLGTLRGPAASGATDWDLDGDTVVDFRLTRNTTASGFVGAGIQPFQGGNRLVLNSIFSLRNAPDGAAIGVAWAYLGGSSKTITSSGSNIWPGEFAAGANQIGFRFDQGGDTHYGWASLVIDFEAEGQGFKITEAYYQSTPDAAINVGQVPVAVPEPASIAFYSNMALLAIGSAGVRAWRARRGQSA